MPRLPNGYFPKVKEAKAKLMEKAEEILNLQLMIIKAAIAARDFETAAKANQFLIEHMPDEDGETMISISVDKPKQIEQRHGPQINIGFQLGGITPKAALPAAQVETVETVEAEVVNESAETGTN